MLIEFSVKNHLSIREKQTFSMVAGDDVERARPHRAADTGFEIAPRVLTSACIVGPNGAGKTSLADAMSFMSRFVKFFYPREDHGDIKLKPFAFHTDWKEMPSEFEVKFIQNDTVYQYGFSLTATRVEEEWLFARDREADNDRTLFTREYNEGSDSYDWDLGSKNPESELDFLKSHTRHENLFLSTAVNFNVKGDFEVAHNWITNNFLARCDFSYPFIASTAEKFHNDGWKNRVLKFFRHHGIFLDDIVVEEQIPVQTGSVVEPAPKLAPRVKFIRKNNAMSSVAVDMLEESTGIRELFNLASPILETMDRGATLFADDVGFGLHSVAFGNLVSMFYNPEVNRRNAQLIFTTHDIGMIDYARIDSDQIWLMNRNEALATELYPYSDFDTSKQRTFTNGYLDGRYGAVPRPPRAWQ